MYSDFTGTSRCMLHRRCRIRPLFKACFAWYDLFSRHFQGAGSRERQSTHLVWNHYVASDAHRKLSGKKRSISGLSFAAEQPKIRSAAWTDIRPLQRGPWCHATTLKF